MKVYSVNVFNSQGDLVNSGYANSLVYKYDYLSLEKNTIDVIFSGDEPIANNDIIVIRKDDIKISGIVFNQEMKNGYSIITYYSLLKLLDNKILFNTDIQGSNIDLLVYMKDCIGTIVNNDPQLKQSKNLSLSTQGDPITKWGFNLKAEIKNSAKCVINFFESICEKALVKYGIFIQANYNENTKAIEYIVKHIPNGSKVIEGDLVNIIQCTVSNKTSESTNVVDIYDTTGNKATFYLTKSGTITRSLPPINERVEPLVKDIKLIELGEKDTFVGKSQDTATDTLKVASYENSIEIEILKDDQLIQPLACDIGQIIRLRYKGMEYTSIYTGFELNSTFTMKFGTIRNDLTKRLKKGI